MEMEEERNGTTQSHQLFYLASDGGGVCGGIETLHLMGLVWIPPNIPAKVVGGPTRCGCLSYPAPHFSSSQAKQLAAP